MNRISSLLATLAVAALLLGHSHAAESRITTPEHNSKICPITGKPADPSISTEYEGLTYGFADEASRAKFMEARKNSLYEKLGGKAALNAVVDRFYEKIVADERVKHIFEDINMKKQIRRQKEFLAAAFGGPIPWIGKDLRRSHASISGLNDSHFNAIAEHLQSTLVEFKVDKQLIDQVMAIVESVRADVLNRPVAKK